jgi:hypothetical protein
MSDDSPTLAHVFALFEKIELNMVEEKVVTFRFRRDTTTTSHGPHNLVVVVVGVVEVRDDPS